MGRAEGAWASEHRGSGTKARFIRWELEGNQEENSHTLTSLEPQTVKVTLQVEHAIRPGRHGLALYTNEQQLVWSIGPVQVDLEPGRYELCHSLPMLPLRPGPYNWLATLYDGTELVDCWNCTPDMIVMTESHQSPYDEWTGLLNLPDTFSARLIPGSPLR